VLYVCLYPAWVGLGPAYGRAVVRLYQLAGPLIEHPLRTQDVTFRDSQVVIHTTENYGFTVENKNLYIDLPIFAALVACLPGLAWATRLRIGLLGYLPLAVAHFLAFALAMHLAYVEHDLVHEGIMPSFAALYLAAPARRILYSDLILLLPFLVCGALFLVQTRRTMAAR
jgi:hypothetical protein